MITRSISIFMIQLLALSILLPDPGAAQEIVESLPIEEVVVYSDRALIVRHGAVHLQAGAGGITLENLPAHLDRNSLRVSGEGPGRIQGIDILDRFDSPRLEGERLELTRKIESLRKEIANREDLLTIIESQRELLISLKDFGSSRLVDDATRGGLSTAQWPELIGAFGSEMRKLTDQRRETAEKLETLVKERGDLQRTLKELGNSENHRTLAAQIELEADRAGQFDIEVSYVVRNCGWRPLYDVRLDRNEGEVDLTQHAEITQATGEMWNNVKLSLSTARPAVGAAPPELLPWYVDYHKFVRGSRNDKSRFFAGEIMLNEEDVRGAGESLPTVPLEIKKQQIGLPVAETVTHLTSMVFEIDRRVTLESRRPPHRVTVASHRMETTLEHYAVPKLMETVFLNGEVENSSTTTLLPGEFSVFLESNYVGKSYLRDLVSPGESFRVSFGADEGLEVKREIVKRESDPGFKSVKETFGYRIELTNFKKTACTLVLLDQLPVSRQDDIDVNLHHVSFEPTGDSRDDEKGILRWEFGLESGETKSVEFEFRVNHPKGVSVAGL